MNTKKSLAQALTNYFIGAQPLAMLDTAAESLLNQAANTDFVEALAARQGQPLPQARNVEMRGETAVLRVIGPVFRYDNIFTRFFGFMSLEGLAKDFSTLQGEEFKDKIKQIVMVFDSPGGEARGIAEMAEMIKRSKKPVTAYVDGMCASAGYWLASAASRIIVSKTAELGSIGAVLGIRTDRDSGIVKIVSSQSPLKQADPATEEGRTELQQRIDALAQVFIEDVAENRKVSVETVLSDFGKGGIKIGEQAVAAGMADEIGSFEGLVAG
jgi:ClpP class serine protease